MADKTSSSMAAMFGAVKGSMEAIKEWLATRVADGKLAMRNTRGNPAFTRVATVYYALSKDAADLDRDRPGGPVCKFDDLLDLTDFMAFAIAGHDGWETTQAVRSIEAAADGRTIIHSTPRRDGE